MTYLEYKNTRQKEVNELPIFFAFGNKQFEEQLSKRGLTTSPEDLKKICRIGDCGGFCLKSDLPVIKACLGKDDGLSELMKDHEFAVSAFRYEMDNHEYAINYQGDWDVCSCFTDREPEFSEEKTYVEYLTEAGMEDLIPAYREAKKGHMKAAEEWA